MKVLSLNCGSSSIRWGLYEVAEERTLATGKVAEVHDPELAWPRVRDALRQFSGTLAPDAVGHRVVHGGERFTDAVRIDSEIVRAIEEQVRLAPAHNPRCLQGIGEAQRIFPDVPHVAIFDTAFPFAGIEVRKSADTPTDDTPANSCLTNLFAPIYAFHSRGEG